MSLSSFSEPRIPDMNVRLAFAEEAGGVLVPFDKVLAGRGTLCLIGR